MEVGDRADLAAERRYLADHVHPPLPLLSRLEFGKLRRAWIDVESWIAIGTFRGDPKTSDVELLQAATELRGGKPLPAKPTLLRRKLLDERRWQAPGGMAGSALQQHGLLSGDSGP